MQPSGGACFQRDGSWEREEALPMMFFLARIASAVTGMSPRLSPRIVPSIYSWFGYFRHVFRLHFRINGHFRIERRRHVFEKRSVLGNA